MYSEQEPDPPSATRLPLADASPAPAGGKDGCGMVVARWTRYGKDHLYVSSPDGTRLGYWDLETEQSYPTAPEFDTLLRSAALGWTAPQPTSPQRWPRVVNLFGDRHDGPSRGRS